MANTQRRRKIWEIESAFMCSVIGTCLTPSDLRKLMVKADVQHEVEVTDYDIHSFVARTMPAESLAERKLARLVNKTIDKRYAKTIALFRQEKTSAELQHRWEEACDSGDVPGPYWAILTHPLACKSLRTQVYRDVHMLSHIVGAVNRADTQRLRRLEAELVANKEKARTAEQRLRQSLRERDEKIDSQNRSLTSEKAVRERLEDELLNCTPAAASKITRLQAALTDERRKYQNLVEVVDTKQAEIVRLREAQDDLLRQIDDYSEECRAIEGQLLEAIKLQNDEEKKQKTNAAVNLTGSRVLYLGGRKNMYPHFRDLVSRCNGKFILHDGGVENSKGQLQSALAKADIVFCPVDCVSHSACLEAKKLCRSCGKCFVPLKNSGMSSLMRGLVHATSTSTNNSGPV